MNILILLLRNFLSCAFVGISLLPTDRPGPSGRGGKIGSFSCKIVQMLFILLDRFLRMSHLYCYAFENIDDWRLNFALCVHKMDMTCTSDTKEMRSDE